MRVALTGANYCGQYFPVPPPHEGVWLPYAPTLDAMFQAVGKTPDWADVVVFVLPETAPLPIDLEKAPGLTVGVVIDWHQWSDALLAHAPAFDAILGDVSCTNAIGRLYPGKTVPFNPMWNFSQVNPNRELLPLADRPHDVVFIGRILPAEQFRGRNNGLGWLYRLADRFDVRILTKVSHEEYIETLCTTKMMFNHASWLTQKSVNARYFEAGACGMLVLGEASNESLDAFFGDTVLLYDESTLAERIEWVIRNPDAAQERANRLHALTQAPVMPKLLETLESLIAKRHRTRGTRSVGDLLTGFVCGFGNWGEHARRYPIVLQMLLDIAGQTGGSRLGDASLLNVLGVAMAEIVEELARFGSQGQASAVQKHTRLSPELLWKQAMRLDAVTATPALNLGRYYARFEQYTRARDALTQARTRLDAYGENAAHSSVLTYPVWTAQVTGLDRTLAFYLNETPFLTDEKTRRRRRANLLRWRVEELLGDLAARHDDKSAALTHYLAAADAAPDIATEALRKATAVAEYLGDRTTVVTCLERIVALNPLDLPYRERLDALYAAQGRDEAGLREEIRLLRKAIPNPEAFHRPPPEEV
jgi:tetratricopeptide (TPR) repeat protein